MRIIRTIHGNFWSMLSDESSLWYGSWSTKHRIYRLTNFSLFLGTGTWRSSYCPLEYRLLLITALVKSLLQCPTFIIIITGSQSPTRSTSARYFKQFNTTAGSQNTTAKKWFTALKYNGVQTDAPDCPSWSKPHLGSARVPSHVSGSVYTLVNKNPGSGAAYALVTVIGHWQNLARPALRMWG